MVFRVLLRVIGVIGRLTGVTPTPDGDDTGIHTDDDDDDDSRLWLHGRDSVWKVDPRVEYAAYEERGRSQPFPPAGTMGPKEQFFHPNCRCDSEVTISEEQRRKIANTFKEHVRRTEAAGTADIVVAGDEAGEWIAADMAEEVER